MKLENQIVSLELSKELKEAGYKQEGLWIWEPALPIYPKYEPITKSYLYSKDSSWFSCSSVVAPTVAELGEALPNIVDYITPKGIKTKALYMQSQKGSDGIIGYEEILSGNYYRIHFEYVDNEANARAKCWLYLKKENLL